MVVRKCLTHMHSTSAARWNDRVQQHLVVGEKQCYSINGHIRDAFSHAQCGGLSLFVGQWR